MKKPPARFVLAIAATLVFVLSCYGLARAYLSYEAARAEHMLKELGDIKIGDPESQVIAIMQQYGDCRKLIDPLTKFDKADYEYLTDIGPSGIYYLVDRANIGAFHRMTREVLSSLNPRLRRAIGLRRWDVYGRVGLKDKRVKVVAGVVMVEGSHEWLAGNWTLVDAIPDSEIDKFVTTPGVSSPYSNRYVIGASRLIAMETQNGGGEASGASITPSATEDEKRSAHEFRWNCLTSRTACRTVCDLYPAAEEYANIPTSEGKRELCAAPSARNSYW